MSETPEKAEETPVEVEAGTNTNELPEAEGALVAGGGATGRARLNTPAEK